MWTPQNADYKYLATKDATFTTDAHGTTRLHLELLVKVPSGAKPELWLHPENLPPTQDPPDALIAKHPKTAHQPNGEVSISHSFVIAPAYKQKVLTPVFGTAADGAQGSPILVP